MRYFMASDGVSLGTDTPNRNGSGTYRPLIVEPNGTVDIDDIVGRDLLPGQYEVFVQRNVDSGFSPDTMLAAFDVTN